MIKAILLPTDGSDTAMNASELAIDMAKRYEARWISFFGPRRIQ